MLDLKDLEKRLDKALASETRESLTRWLMAKKFTGYIKGSTEGEFDIICKNSSTFTRPMNPKIDYETPCEQRTYTFNMAEAA